MAVSLLALHAGVSRGPVLPVDKLIFVHMRFGIVLLWLLVEGPYFDREGAHHHASSLQVERRRRTR
jgi:hypothetical protein